MIERLGHNLDDAMNLGMPGNTDNQRSGAFRRCVEKQTNWRIAYEHYGQYQSSGGEDGASLITNHYPEVRYLYNANSVMRIGVVTVIENLPPDKKLLINKWSRSARKLDYFKRKLINTTPMKMWADQGFATAEAIRYVLEGSKQGLPLIFLNLILIANNQMSVKKLDALQVKAFAIQVSDMHKDTELMKSGAN